jgi:aminoglycoside phosphotransferase (APT) family kinase protein
MLPPDVLARFGVRPDEVEKLREKGAAHTHWRLGKTGLLLRVPRLSQWGMGPEENLAYQVACFRRAEPSGATPRLAEVIEPSPSLPRGALAVEEIVGRVPRLPDDLPAIAAALAAIHALPVPPTRAPLVEHTPDPLGATAAALEAQRALLDEVAMPEATKRALAKELARMEPAPSPVTLVGTDTHPGNFIVRGDGHAVLVDLEKSLYGAPAIDLAHATLPTSTLWDMDVATELSPAATAAFYATWLDTVPKDLAASVRESLGPARRITFLRTMLWCVRWRRASSQDGEWSAARLDPGLLAHIAGRVALFLSPEFVERARTHIRS